MYQATSAIPRPAHISASCHDYALGRLRVIHLGEADGQVTIHVDDRPVLDALQAALDAIRADFDAADAVPVAVMA